MISIGAVELGRVPRLAVPLDDRDIGRNAERAMQWGDIVELRIDLFHSLDAAHVASVCRAVRGTGAPLLVTVRSTDQGGGAAIADRQRLALFEVALPLADAVDVELRSPLCEPVLTLAEQHGAVGIVSHHDFAATPNSDQLTALVRESINRGAAITKIAATANSDDDRNRLLDLLRSHQQHNLIVIAMGAYGAASRVFFPLCGSLITYGFLDDAVAPGQLSACELRAELRRYCPDLA